MLKEYVIVSPDILWISCQETSEFRDRFEELVVGDSKRDSVFQQFFVQVCQLPCRKESDLCLINPKHLLKLRLCAVVPSC